MYSTFSLDAGVFTLQGIKGHVKALKIENGKVIVELTPIPEDLPKIENAFHLSRNVTVDVLLIPLKTIQIGNLLMKEPVEENPPVKKKSDKFFLDTKTKEKFVYDDESRKAWIENLPFTKFWSLVYSHIMIDNGE